MRHLITGGSGFVGNLVARRLRERGEQVRVLDVWDDASRPRDIEYVQCSVLDQDGVAAAMQEVDVVHHNAALVAQTDAGRDYWQVNVEGARIVCGAIGSQPSQRNSPAFGESRRRKKFRTVIYPC